MCDPQEQYECADPAYFYFVQNYVTDGDILYLYLNICYFQTEKLEEEKKNTIDLMSIDSTRNYCNHILLWKAIAVAFFLKLYF